MLGTLVVWSLDVDTPRASSQATIPTGLAALPVPTSLDRLPDLSMSTTLRLDAIAIVALAQGAGTRPAFSNPDGSACRRLDRDRRASRVGAAEGTKGGTGCQLATWSPIHVRIRGGELSPLATVVR